MTTKQERVEQELEAIPELSRAALIQKWEAAYKRPPPKGISRRLLEYAAAYNIQVKAFGGLKPETKRKLLKVAEENRNGSDKTVSAPKSKKVVPGSRLVRDWHGKTHIIDVLDKGFRYGDQHYRSLSEVARTITGARWSGPRFFGL